MPGRAIVGGGLSEKKGLILQLNKRNTGVGFAVSDCWLEMVFGNWLSTHPKIMGNWGWYNKHVEVCGVDVSGKWWHVPLFCRKHMCVRHDNNLPPVPYPLSCRLESTWHASSQQVSHLNTVQCSQLEEPGADRNRRHSTVEHAINL